MDQLIPEIFKYALISVGMVLLFWLMRDFMVNHDPLRFRRGLRKMPGLDILESEKELEIPFEKGGIPDLEKRLKQVAQSPQRIAEIIRCWLREDEPSESLERD